MLNSSTSAAATSSCVDSGYDAQSTTSAPPAFSVRIRFAVSVVTCRHAATRWPASGCSRSKRSRIAVSTGICRSAHSMRRLPSPASARSFTSCLICVDAIVPLLPVSLGGQEPLVLALFEVEPVVDDRLEPLVDGRRQERLAAEPEREREVVEAEPEVVAQPPQPQQARDVPLVVEAVPRVRARRREQAVVLEVAQHARRPAAAASRLLDRVPGHVGSLTQTCQGCGASAVSN